MKIINKKIRELVLEIVLVAIFTIVSIPLWDYIGNETLGNIAEHYDNTNSNIVITNKKKHIISENYEEAIYEMNMALITSYENEMTNHDIYLLIPCEYDYTNIMFSNGKYINKLSDLYYDTIGNDMYFKIDNKDINSKETIEYNYYIWSYNIKNDKKIKIKFAII